MKIDFLSASEAADLRVPDVYYRHEYGRTAEFIDGGTWECALGDGGAFVQVYLNRPIPGAAEGEYDIISPYGYASPVARDGDTSGISDFRHAFLEQSKERGLVAEFLRTNPFDTTAGDLESLRIDQHRSHLTFGIRALVDGADYFETVEGRHRTAVRKAVKREVHITASEVAAAAEPSAPFRRIYDATMERVGAVGRLRLPDAYFRSLAEGLGEDAIVLEAHADNDVCAAAIFMRSADRLHYHLSGATPDGLKLGATNLILDHAVRELLPASGQLHLGGGVQPGDGLERFKRSAATDEHQVFFCQTQVNPQRYAELVAASGASDTEYFPAYRAAGR